jgi:hypothetical protein
MFGVGGIIEELHGSFLIVDAGAAGIGGELALTIVAIEEIIYTVEEFIIEFLIFFVFVGTGSVNLFFDGIIWHGISERIL